MHAAFGAPGLGWIEMQWISPDLIDEPRDAETRWLPVAGLGDEGYVHRYGREVIARRGPHVLRVEVQLPGGREVSGPAVVALARAVLDAVPLPTA
jgi:hypothetical protein